MKFTLVIIIFLSVSAGAIAQPDCSELHNVMDSVWSLNKIMKEHTGDTVFIRQLVREKYRPLILYGDEPSSFNTGYAMYEMGLDRLGQLHQCLVDYANQNGWYIVVKEPDSYGFRKVTIYESKKKKEKILWYDKGILIQKDKIILALSIHH